MEAPRKRDGKVNATGRLHIPQDDTLPRLDALDILSIQGQSN